MPFQGFQQQVYPQNIDSTAQIVTGEDDRHLPGDLFLALQQCVIETPTSFDSAEGVFDYRLSSFVFSAVVQDALFVFQFEGAKSRNGTETGGLTTY